MKNAEYRELQVSSTQLAVIFIGILLLGVVIFLLGVSVGKKQAQVSEKVNIIAEKKPEQLKEKITLPDLKTGPESAKAEERMAAETKTEEPAPAKQEKPTTDQPVSTRELGVQKPAPDQKVTPGSAQWTPLRKSNFFYVQVGALAEKPAALETAEHFKKLGYEVVVLDPMPLDRTPLYRVRVGGFPTRAEAESARTRLAQAAGRKVDYFIVRD